MWETVFASPALSDAATITAGPYAPSMPPSFLQKQQPKDRLRLTDRTQAVITLDLTDAMTYTRVTEWDLVAPLYMLAYDADDQVVSLDTASYTITAAGSLAGLASPTWTQAVNAWPSADLYHHEIVRAPPSVGASPVIGRGIHSFHLTEPRTETFVRLTFTLPVAVSYLDVGRAYVSKALIPSAGVAFRPRHGVQEEERRHRTFRGSTIAREMPQSEVVEVVVQERATGALAAYYSGLHRLRKTRGACRDVLVVLDTGGYDSESDNPSVGDMIVMGLMTGLGADDLPDTGHGSFPVRIEELT